MMIHSVCQSINSYTSSSSSSSRRRSFSSSRFSTCQSVSKIQPVDMIVKLVSKCMLHIFSIQGMLNINNSFDWGPYCPCTHCQLVSVTYLTGWFCGGLKNKFFLKNQLKKNFHLLNFFQKSKNIFKRGGGGEMLHCL